MLGIGEIKTQRTRHSGTAIWHACIDCGKERWVSFRKGKPVHPRCVSCGNKGKNIGEKNKNWKGGRIVAHGRGYPCIKVYADDFFYPMVDNRGYVPEHRLVMAKHLGRNLHRWEIVHHRNHIRDNNRIENLQLVTDDRHKQITTLEMQIKKLKAENQALRKQLLTAT